MYDRGAWFLRVARFVLFTVSEEAKTKHPTFFRASALADNPYLDLDYSGYHNNLIQ